MCIDSSGERQTRHTYHIDDLLECQSELDNKWIGLVGHGPLQCVVCGQQTVQQPLLVRPLLTFCELGAGEESGTC